MSDIKEFFAKKLQQLRTQAGLTQSELGDKLSYSDKTVSKWERGESIPDATVLKKLSRLFGVSVDSLLDDSPEKKAAQHTASEPGSVSRRAIVRVSVVGIWTLATLLFVIFWVFLESIHWLIFVFAVPVTLIMLLVFNSIWHSGKGNFWIVSGLVLSVIVLMYLTLLSRNNPWQLFLVAAPAELLVYCSFRIKKRKK